jgi:hypothetical protein
MKKNEITRERGNPVAEVIPPAHVHQFVSKNVEEFLRFQAAQELIWQQDPRTPPTSSRRRSQARN